MTTFLATAEVVQMNGSTSLLVRLVEADDSYKAKRIFKLYCDGRSLTVRGIGISAPLTENDV